MQCECYKCRKKATHLKVIIAGVENNYCDEHFNIIKEQLRF